MTPEIERRLEAAGVRVLGLTWQAVSSDEYWSANSIYCVSRAFDGFWRAYNDELEWVSDRCRTPEAAKSAAEAHHRAAVLAQLGVVE